MNWRTQLPVPSRRGSALLVAMVVVIAMSGLTLVSVQNASVALQASRQFRGTNQAAPIGESVFTMGTLSVAPYVNTWQSVGWDYAVQGAIPVAWTGTCLTCDPGSGDAPFEGSASGVASSTQYEIWILDAEVGRRAPGYDENWRDYSVLLETRTEVGDDALGWRRAWYRGQILAGPFSVEGY